ncbi:hypothetical protein NRZ32_04490 [Aeromonas dhakensis]|nr:hypothetical protein [Aeromonas dhakensis]WAG12403.1 hypothetical protein NRZ32_04490 [Aeromonas dhakensis]
MTRGYWKQKKEQNLADQDCGRTNASASMGMAEVTEKTQKALTDAE